MAVVRRWLASAPLALLALAAGAAERPVGDRSRHTNEPLEFAQACGRNACEVVLLESVGGALRVVARGRAEAGCDTLDLAPYWIKPGETLIGVRGVVTMAPRSDGPADIQLRYARQGEPGTKLSARIELYRWDGRRYAPRVPRRSSAQPTGAAFPVRVARSR